jgi:hypothetical protein
MDALKSDLASFRQKRREIRGGKWRFLKRQEGFWVRFVGFGGFVLHGRRWGMDVTAGA